MHSATPRTFRTLRRFSLIGICSSALVLAACTPSPSPNQPLVEMLIAAQSDSQALQNSATELSNLRAEHAEELHAEINRLCGFNDEGLVPESCTVEVPAIAAAQTDDVQGRVEESQGNILDQLDSVPPDSLALITQQYIDQAAFAETPAAPSIAEVSARPWDLKSAEIDTARDLLQREYSAAWALGVALAYIDPSQEELVAEAIDHHRERAALLRVILNEEPLPSSESGYESDLDAPIDATSASEMLSTISTNLVSAWHAASTTASTPAWRELSTQIAGDTQRDLSA